MHKTIHPVLAVVIIILAVVVIGYFAGVRIWVSNTPAFPDNSYQVGVAAAHIGVGHIGGVSVSVGVGHKSINICLGCSTISVPSTQNTTNYQSQSQQLQNTNDRDSGTSNGSGNSSGSDGSSSSGTDNSGNDNGNSDCSGQACDKSSSS